MCWVGIRSSGEPVVRGQACWKTELAQEDEPFRTQGLAWHESPAQMRMCVHLGFVTLSKSMGQIGGIISNN